jgi:hypothetical protein
MTMPTTADIEAALQVVCGECSIADKPVYIRTIRQLDVWAYDADAVPDSRLRHYLLNRSYQKAMLHLQSDANAAGRGGATQG